MADGRRVPVRVRCGELILAMSWALAPAEAPAWRWDLAHRPCAVLAVGEPTPSITGRGLDDR